MNSTNALHEEKTFQIFSYLWVVPAGALAFSATSSIFKDNQDNEWQLKYVSTKPAINSAQKVEFILSLAKFGPGVRKDGTLETMVSIHIVSDLGKARGHEICETKFNEAKFTPDNNNFTRLCVGDLKGGLLRSLSEFGVLRIRCQIWTQKFEGPDVADLECGCLSVQFKALLNDRMFHDVNIRVADLVIPAHRAILAARSVVFRAMFDTDMVESLGSEVTIVGFSEPVVRGMLEFVYTDKTTIAFEDAEEWLRISDMYELTNLKIMVDSAVIGNLNVENAVCAYRWAKLYNRSLLSKVATAFIKSNWIAVTNGNDFMDFAKSDPEGMVGLFRSLPCP